jgi:phosphoribosylamine--glycine ligase
VTVALVDEGYPDQVRGGGAIEGLADLEAAGDVVVFHAGSVLEDGLWRVRGGRAAYVTATAASAEQARDRVYAAIATLRGGGWRCRHDIAATTVSATTGAAPHAPRSGA